MIQFNTGDHVLHVTTGKRFKINRVVATDDYEVVDIDDGNPAILVNCHLVPIEDTAVKFLEQAMQLEGK